MSKKSVIEEPEYHGKGHESTIIYYMLIIPVIYTDLLEAPRFPYQKRFHNKGHLNLVTEVLKSLVQEFSTVPDVTHSKTSYN